MSEQLNPAVEKREQLARAVQRAVLAKVRCWQALRDAEHVLGVDIDDFESQIDEIAVGVDDQYPFAEARAFAADLIVAVADNEAEEI